jgi:ABC-2 type transport system permease protein
MNALGAFVRVELVKLFSSKVLLVTALTFVVFTPTMIMGPNFSPLQTLYIEGSFCFSILAAWVFGREFVQKTATELLTFPVSRSTVVFAKTIALIVGVLALTAGNFVLTSAIAVATDGWAKETFAADLARQGVVTAMILSLCMPIFFLGLCSRGYFLPIAVSIAVVLYVNIDSSSLPFTLYIPWSIPLAYALGDRIPRLLDIVILLGMGLGGLAASLVWWRYANHT